MSTQPQGETAIISAGGYTAVLTEVGANLSSLTSPTGRALVLPSPATEIRKSSAGALLAPWPNRIEGGTYTWCGTEYQLPLNEVAMNNASHGLVSWERWSFGEIQEQDGAQSVTATLQLVPVPGYPFSLKFAVTYTVNEQGLTTEFTARNLGDEPAPYAVGAHPYLMAGTNSVEFDAVDNWSLQASVTTYLEVNENMIPIAEKAVTESLDLTQKLPLRDVQLDHAFGGMQKNEAGEITVTLSAPNGEKTVLTAGEGIEWLQFYTDDAKRRGVAVEPMTAPANAFNTGTDLLVLAPGEEHRVWWRISA